MALLVPQAAHAAAYLPGTDAPDQPTGENGTASAEEPLRGNGIRWEFAPWRVGGSLALDARWQRFEDHRRSTQAQALGDIDFLSYVWQPWFIQVRGGVGALLARSRTAGSADALGDSEANAALTGRVSVSVFPASRFPFELRADVSDTRTSGDTLGADYRSSRLSLSQAWRPEVGNDTVNLNLDHSRLMLAGGNTDTLTTFTAAAMRQLPQHTIELGSSFSDNRRSESDDGSRLALLSARHAFHPDSGLQVETLGTWNDVRLRGRDLDSGTDLRQLSSYATWRPRDGEPLYREGEPLTLSGSARWVEATSRGSDGNPVVQALNATVGATQELARTWRVSAAASAGRVHNGAGATDNHNANVATSWTPLPLTVAGWRWAPGVSANAGSVHVSGNPDRRIVGGQFTHSASREVELGDGHHLSFSLAQTAAALHENVEGASSRAIVHSGSLYWQSASDGRSQGFAGLSLTESRTWSPDLGRYLMANLQWSQRIQFSRMDSLSANLTLQATRNDGTQIDALTGEKRLQTQGWQHFHYGTLNLEQQRLFGVPRLRHTLLVGVSSQQLERRAAGDIEAPREHVSASIESRLDHAIGRLETRLSARVARVDGRTVAAVLARAQRRF